MNINSLQDYGAVIFFKFFASILLVHSVRFFAPDHILPIYPLPIVTD